MKKGVVNFVRVMTVALLIEEYWSESVIQGGIIKMLFHKNQTRLLGGVGKFMCPCSSLNVLA